MARAVIPAVVRQIAAMPGDLLGVAEDSSCRRITIAKKTSTAALHPHL